MAALTALLERGEAGQEAFLEELEKKVRNASGEPAAKKTQATLDEVVGSLSEMIRMLERNPGACLQPFCRGFVRSCSSRSTTGRNTSGGPPRGASCRRSGLEPCR